MQAAFHSWLGSLEFVHPRLNIMCVKMLHHWIPSSNAESRTCSLSMLDSESQDVIEEVCGIFYSSDATSLNCKS